MMVGNTYPYKLQNGFGHNFSAPRTPQQNGVVERRKIDEFTILNKI